MLPMITVAHTIMLIVIRVSDDTINFVIDFHEYILCHCCENISYDRLYQRRKQLYQKKQKKKKTNLCVYCVDC